MYPKLQRDQPGFSELCKKLGIDTHSSNRPKMTIEELARIERENPDNLVGDLLKEILLSRLEMDDEVESAWERAMGEDL